MSAHVQTFQQASVLSGRQLVMVVIIVLHGAVIAALMAIRIMPDATTRTNDIIATFETERQALPPPPRELEVMPTGIRVDVPVVPLIDIPQLPPSEQALVTPVEPTVRPGAGVPAGSGEAPVHEIASTALQFRAVRPADDYYPGASLRLEEQGAAVVRVCVAPNGRLDGAPEIQASSGSPRLDAAAIRWAREALRFTPATRNGEPVAACKGFRVNFKLH